MITIFEEKGINMQNNNRLATVEEKASLLQRLPESIKLIASKHNVTLYMALMENEIRTQYVEPYWAFSMGVLIGDIDNMIITVHELQPTGFRYDSVRLSDCSQLELFMELENDEPDLMKCVMDSYLKQLDIIDQSKVTLNGETIGYIHDNSYIDA
jgi:hypothetical protein